VSPATDRSRRNWIGQPLTPPTDVVQRMGRISDQLSYKEVRKWFASTNGLGATELDVAFCSTMLIMITTAW
jgi:hypothetical protein